MPQTGSWFKYQGFSIAAPWLVPTVGPIQRSGTIAGTLLDDDGNELQAGCIVLLGGVAVTLQTATLTKGQNLLILVMSASGTATIQLDNGGTLLGQSGPYAITSGAGLVVSFDGANLVANSQ